MAQQEEGANRDGLFSFLDGVLDTASQTAQGYWATRYGRTEQVPPASDAGGVDPDVARSGGGEPMIAGVPQSTLMLGFGGLLLVLLLVDR